MGVRQGAKIRLIDDFSESFVNLAVTRPDKITGEGVDKVAPLAKLWARLLQSKCVEVSLSTGEVLRGQRHEVFESSRAIAAKCFDLEAACKQCPLADDEAQLSVVAIEDPVQPRGLLYFWIFVLPFGAVGSVPQFDLVAARIKRVVLKSLGVPCVSYFDDFPVMVPTAVSAVCGMAFEALGPVTGWLWKMSTVSSPFSDQLSAPGVVFNLSLVTSANKLCVTNTEDRIRDLCPQAFTFWTKGFMSQAEAAQTAGRVGFAGSQIFGKTGTAVLWHLRRRAAGKPMTPLLACSLSAWCEALSTALPRYVPLGTFSPPKLMFTDGFCDACSDGKAGIGAVLVDDYTRARCSRVTAFIGNCAFSFCDRVSLCRVASANGNHFGLQLVTRSKKPTLRNGYVCVMIPQVTLGSFALKQFL